MLILHWRNHSLVLEWLIMDIYSLKAIALREGVTYSYLRALMPKIAKGEITSWRGYRFFGPGKKYWLAYPETETVVFHDAGDTEE